MSKKIQLEIVFWMFTLVVVAAVLLPIYTSIPDYPFWVSNIAFIVVGITVARYIFLLRHTFLARQQLLKTACIFLCIPLLFYLVQEINYFQTYLDEQGTDAIVGHLPLQERGSMIAYVRNQILLFGVLAVISCVIFPIRLIVSIWRTHNRGTV